MRGMVFCRVSVVGLIVAATSVAWGSGPPAINTVAACLRGIAASAGSDLSTQLSIVAEGCAGASPGLAELAAAEPSRKAAGFISRACGPDAARFLSSSERDRWQMISSACGVAKPPTAVASLEWVVYAKINAWLSVLASDPSLAVQAVAAEAIAASKGPARALLLPIAARWGARYALATGYARFTDEVSSRRYVLVSDGRVFAGRWPVIEFDKRGPITPAFGGAEVSLDALSGKLLTLSAHDPCPSTVVIADGRMKAVRLGEIAHALSGCEVRIGVAVGETLAEHLVRIRSGQAQAAADPEMPSWLKNPKVERLTPHGTVADLVHKLDQLAAKSVFIAQLD